MANKYWRVAELAFEQQSLVYQLTKMIRREEQHLVWQLTRAARSVCACLAEAYGKKRYPMHLISKLTDAEAENLETRVWLDIAVENGLCGKTDVLRIVDLNEQVGKLLYYMIQNANKFSHRS
jgi:four helix bundle protein